MAAKKVGRPQSGNAFTRAARTFKTHATGETKNSPTTTPNIIFFLGLFLIIASAWTSGRLKNLFFDIWTPVSAAQKQDSAKVPDAVLDLGNQIRVIGLQLLAVFTLTILARFVPPLARPILIVVVGVTILWFIRNPTVLQWLNAQEQEAAKFQNPATPATPVLTAVELQKTQQNLQLALQARGNPRG